jgi:hypothetical protein
MSSEDRSLRVASLLFPGLVVVALGLVLIPTCVDRYMAHIGEIAFGPNDPPGPMPNATDWPRPLQELQRELGDGTRIDGYLLYGAPGEFLVKDAAFRIEASPLVLNRIVDRLELVHVDANHRLLQGWGKDTVSIAGKEWWPNESGRNANSVDYYLSQGRLDGAEGDLFVAAYDKATEILYIRYDFNF